MVGNLLDQKIIQVFNKDLTKFYSINSIAKKLNKAYPHINQKVNALIDEGIIKKQVFGKSYICSMNLESDLAIAYLTIDEIQNKQKNTKTLSKKIIDNIKDIDAKCVFLYQKKIYAVSETSTKSSDIKTEKSIPLHFIDEEKFKEMIIKTDFLTNHAIIQNFEYYFSTLKKIWGEIRLRGI
ncbi:hypothetical protein C0585_05890 [Candidatus Woesearchaeota archaeon]|nr:MAG: hypothetical protein C0585_05890 [Candidatus Woesearchaeota archaeon]